jgi:TetR/AcrR family transcriptional regulator
MPARNHRDSRKLIHAAARREFEEYGFAGARVGRIAARAGVNKQLLFYYFGSKAGLFRAVLESVSQDVLAAAVLPDGIRAPTDRLRESVHRLFQALASNADVVRLILLDSRGAGEADRAPLGSAVRKLIEAVQALVSEGQGLGYFRDDIEPELVATQALAIAAGYLALGRVAAAPSHPTDQSGWAGAAADLLLRTVTW